MKIIHVLQFAAKALNRDRRRFLGRLSLALSAIAAAMVGIPVVGFIIGPLIRVGRRLARRIGPRRDSQGRTSDISG
jgi:hypothetical protein